MVKTTMEIKIRLPRILAELKNKMARNLVKEKTEEQPKETKEEKAKREFEAEVPKPTEEPKVQIITENQMINMNLNALAVMLQEIKAKMEEGFKQVGVEFKDK